MITIKKIGRFFLAFPLLIMEKYSGSTLKNKIRISFFIALIPGIIALIAVMLYTRQVRSILDETTDIYVHEVNPAGKIKVDVLEMGRSIATYVETGEKQFRDSALSQMNDLEVYVQKLDESGEYPETLPISRHAISRLRVLISEAVVLGREAGMSPRDVHLLMESIDTLIDNLLYALDPVVRNSTVRATSRLEKKEHVILHFSWVISLYIIVSLVLVVSIAVYFSRLITKPFKDLTNNISHISSGNFKERLDCKYNDEFGFLARCVNQMAARLETTINNLKIEQGLLEERVRERTFELKRSETKYKTVFDSSQEIIQVIDIENEQFVDVNPAFEKILGYKPTDLEGLKNIFMEQGMYTYEKSRERALDAFNRGGESYEWVVKNRAGKKLWIDVTVSPLNLYDRTFFLLTVHDITDRKESEEKDLQMQKMDSIGMLAGGIAHDFNNVLSGITAPLSLVDHLLKNGNVDSDELKEYLEMISTSAGRAKRLVQQVLSLSRKTEGEHDQVELNSTVSRVVEVCRTTIDKSVEIRTVLGQSPCWVEGDQTKVEQLILNLCVNAAHAMTIMRPPDVQYGGILEIEIRDGEGDCPGNWTVSVSDTGVGMSKEVCSRIFDPFFTTKDQNVGTGLGLSMVYTILTEMGGEIAVSSEPGRGSVFTLTLPKQDFLKEEEGASEVITIGQGFRGQGTVLVVDDEEMIRTMISRMLEHYGYNVIEAASGRECLDIFINQHENLDMVFLDIIMPGIGGDEVFLMISQIDPAVPVVIASGYVQEDRYKKIQNRGIAGFLHKPFSIDELEKILVKVNA